MCATKRGTQGMGEPQTDGGRWIDESMLSQPLRPLRYPLFNGHWHHPCQSSHRLYSQAADRWAGALIGGWMSVKKLGARDTARHSRMLASLTCVDPAPSGTRIPPPT